MHRFVTLLAIVLLAIMASPNVQATVVSDVYVFGDSLSDQGNDYLITGGAVPPPEYSNGSVFGRFTNGPNYVDFLSEAIGVPVAPSVAGGTNYAYGGARTDYRAPSSPFALSLLEQRDAYLAGLSGASADPRASYLVWGGSNDLGDIVTRLMLDPLYDPLADLSKVASNIASVVASLAAIGAREILVPNVPDLGLVPAVTGGGPRNVLVSALVAGFNSGLSDALAAVDAAFPQTQIVDLDAFGLLGALYRDPATYGLSNVTEGCYSSYVRPGGTVCSAPAAYLFWDAEHPSSTAHRVFAANVARVVPTPATLPLTVAGVMLMVAARSRRY